MSSRSPKDLPKKPIPLVRFVSVLALDVVSVLYVIDVCSNSGFSFFSLITQLTINQFN